MIPKCAALSLFLLLSGLLAPAQTQRPNIVFLLADDLGWTDLAVYGSDTHETPHLDRLASQGVRFTQAYSASPVCSPTRASILTGKHPARLKMTIWREAAKNPPLDRKVVPPAVRDALPHEQVTLAEVLREAGYLTAHVGKWHLGTAGFYPQTQGFDYNVGGTLWGAPQTFFFPYSGDQHFGGEPRYVPHLEDGEPGEYLTDRLTAEGLRIIERAASSPRRKPFFLHLAYHTVHTPIEGKPEWVEKFEKKIKPGDKHDNVHLAAMVSSLDENVGRVLAKLDELGITEDTVVIFTSDNGGYVNVFGGHQVTDNSPLRSGKGSLYEGGIRVPLMVRWPGVTPAGATCDRPVSSVDFYRTILQMAGVPGDPAHNRDVDGVSLAPLLRDPGAALEREALFFHYPHYYRTTSPVSAVRVGDWKLLEYFEDGKLELYHLGRDRSEKHDLSREQPGKTAELRRRLHAWWRQVDAPLPNPNPAFVD